MTAYIYRVLKKVLSRQGMMAYICNSSTWEAEAGGLQDPGQPQLQSKTLFQQPNPRPQNKIVFGVL
jgi:hypothetical protein